MVDGKERIKVVSLGVMAVIIGAVAMVVLTSIAVVIEYSEFLRTETTARELGITVAANGTLTQVGTPPEYPFITDVTACVNDTNGDTKLLTKANYSVSLGDVSGVGGFVIANTSRDFIGSPVNCTVAYKADSSGQNAADLFVVGLTVFASFASVVVLAIVGIIIVGLFRGGKRKED